MNTCVTGTQAFTKRIPRNLYQDSSHLSTTRPGTMLPQRPAESGTFKVAWPKTDSNPDQVSVPGEMNQQKEELNWDTATHKWEHTSTAQLQVYLTILLRYNFT